MPRAVSPSFAVYFAGPESVPCIPASCTEAARSVALSDFSAPSRIDTAAVEPGWKVSPPLGSGKLTASLKVRSASATTPFFVSSPRIVPDTTPSSVASASDGRSAPFLSMSSVSGASICVPPSANRSAPRAVPDSSFHWSSNRSVAPCRSRPWVGARCSDTSTSRSVPFGSVTCIGTPSSESRTLEGRGSSACSPSLRNARAPSASAPASSAATARACPSSPEATGADSSPDTSSDSPGGSASSPASSSRARIRPSLP